MKIILSQLNKLINELEDQKRFVEVNQLEDVFMRLAKKVKKEKPDEEKGAPKSPPKGYPESKTKYADPTNFKYPIDTKEHVKAALSYIGQARNRKKYDAKELAYIEARIHAAAKKFGIGTDKSEN